ncbi:MAG: acyltransferase [Hyphomicrobiales bacterium]|nr:acyltransferase [Hyphomicrobiales bacterium]
MSIEIGTSIRDYGAGRTERAARSAVGAVVGGRVVQIDMMRFFAFATIAVIHVSWVNTREINGYSILLTLTRYSLPFFFMAAGYFAARHLDDDLAYLKRVYVRLGGLFLFWELIYNGIHFFLYDFGYRCLPTTWREAAACLAATLNSGGVAFHLWFLPWLAVSITIFLGLMRFGWRAVGIGSALLYGLGLAVGPYNEFTGVFPWVERIYPDPIGFTARNGPFFGPLFVAFGALAARRGEVIAKAPWSAIALGMVAGLTLFGSEAIFIAGHGVKMVSNFNFLLGSVLFAPALFFLVMRTPVNPVTLTLSRLGRHALGMYCIHALFTLPYNQLHPATLRLETPLAVSLLQAVWVIAASIAASLILSHVPGLRRFVV